MAMSKHETLKSSNLKSVAYDPETKELEVVFANGGTWRYDDVAAHHVSNLQSHPSAGSYFHQAIKSAHEARKVG